MRIWFEDKWVISLLVFLRHPLWSVHNLLKLVRCRLQSVALLCLTVLRDHEHGSFLDPHAPCKNSSLTDPTQPFTVKIFLLTNSHLCHTLLDVDTLRWEDGKCTFLSNCVPRGIDEQVSPSFSLFHPFTLSLSQPLLVCCTWTFTHIPFFFAAWLCSTRNKKRGPFCTNVGHRGFSFATKTKKLSSHRSISEQTTVTVCHGQAITLKSRLP